jgi:hypothetical protein
MVAPPRPQGVCQSCGRRCCTGRAAVAGWSIGLWWDHGALGGQYGSRVMRTSLVIKVVMHPLSHNWLMESRGWAKCGLGRSQS